MSKAARSLSDAPFDRGLQAERTALAWRRTGLSLALGSLAGARILSPVFGLTAYVLGLLGLAAAAFFMARADRRYRVAHRSLVATAGHPAGARLTSGGGLLIALSVFALIVGGVAAAFVCASALTGR
ncbi:DUF202 domain-containing protein [Subtercola lobariae]|uniref:DUF202 domain-containing protein n=1 Tax=Subtercola lobariae TaxID=1588641 RepID=A0A917B2L0_9MICO|nr:DUF202 domain-containing protein [Subtercola lobariae]GGF17237.1 hypothetical protein GCM10011399_08700 [Subtercola lobariae]